VKQRTDEGAAAVEFALVLPLLLLVLFGIVDFGRAYNAQQALNAGTREGARVKALGTGDAVAATRTAAYPLTPASVNVSSTACTSGGDSHATVSSTYDFSYITPISGIMGLIGASALTSPLTLNAKATFRCS
jgi:Flp pilus assembly protein TadG